ncbi:MAG TPA: hypothetical protein VMU51_19080 [Mycobacteriales bacterium]|nr:hypothetical protein [Mycobacteriales bacterium]
MRGVALAAAATAVVTCTAAASAGPASASAAPASHHAGRYCISYDNLTEQAQVQPDTTATPSATSLVGRSLGEFRNSSGRLVGTEDGTFVAYQKVDGTRAELFQYTAQLPGGSVAGGGTVSITDISLGQEATLSAVGTSGLLRGLTGTWKFTLTGAPAPGVTTFRTVFTLCL